MNSIMTVLVFYVRHNNFWKQFLETVCCSQKMNRKLWFAITRTFRKQKTSLTVLLSVSFLSVTWPRYCLVNTPLASLCTHQQPIIVNTKHLSTPTSTWIEEKSHTGEVWSFEIDTHPRSPYIPVLVCKCLFTWLLCPQCPPRPRPGVPMCRRSHYADLSPVTSPDESTWRVQVSRFDNDGPQCHQVTRSHRTRGTRTRDSPGQVPAWENKNQVNGFLLS